jgi:hypothetical protein
VPNVKVRVEADHSMSFLSLHDLLRKSLTFIFYIDVISVEVFTLLGYYAASSGNPLPKFTYLSHLQGSRSLLTLEDGADTLSRNFGKGLPLDAA